MADGARTVEVHLLRLPVALWGRAGSSGEMAGQIDGRPPTPWPKYAAKT